MANMKGHHCHCGLKSQLHKFRARKLGLVGIVLMGLHILFHVAECLVLPAILVAFSGPHDEATATSSDEIVETVEVGEAELTDFQFGLITDPRSGFSYSLENYYSSRLSR